MSQVNTLPDSRDGWKTVTLPEIAVEFSDGPFGSNLKSEHYVEKGIRVIRLQNVGIGKMLHDDLAFISRQHYESLPRNHCKPGDVIIGTLGDPNLRACVVPEDLPESLNKADCLLFRANKRLAHPAYICALLNSDRVVKLAARLVRGQTRGRISMGRLKELLLPLPPLAEQKRIAAILDAVDALRAKRREALAQLDTLLQSTFLDMFGDPVTNPKGWEMGCLADVVERLDGGKNIAESESATDFRVLKVSAVTSGEFCPEESKFLPAAFKVPKSYLVNQGDLLISRANTAELVGATAYVWEMPRNIVLPDKIWKLVWKKNAQIEPLFIYNLSQSASFRRMLGTRASGTSGSMKNIAKPKLLSLPIPLPPFDVQQRFATIAASIRQQQSLQRSHLAELDTLFASLQSRAFRGDL